jgi:Fic family protein
VGAEALLIGVACSHHRLAWVHPFIDGNGRAARLHAHLVLHAMGLTQGLWSPMRGLARTQEQYYARLNNADLPRRNDLDGRGPLSQEELVAFASYFLEICLDQVRFMRERLDLRSLKGRLKSLLLHLQENPWQIGSEKSVVKLEATEVLHYVAIAGPIERTRFVEMTGLGVRTGRRVLASLLDFGVLSAESHRAPVAFGVPLSSLRFLFPNLWPEVETD